MEQFCGQAGTKDDEVVMNANPLVLPLTPTCPILPSLVYPSVPYDLRVRVFLSFFFQQLFCDIGRSTQRDGRKNEPSQQKVGRG